MLSAENLEIILQVAIPLALFFAPFIILWFILKVLSDRFLNTDSLAGTLKKNHGVVKNYIMGAAQGKIALPLELGDFGLFRMCNTWASEISVKKDAYNAPSYSFVLNYLFYEGRGRTISRIICQFSSVPPSLPEVSCVINQKTRAAHDVESTFPIAINAPVFKTGAEELNRKYIFYGDENFNDFFTSGMKNLLLQNEKYDFFISGGNLLITDRYSIGSLNFIQKNWEDMARAEEFAVKLAEELKRY